MAITLLNLEIELQRRSQTHEVVLLDAASEEALRKTHGRYFENVEGLLAAMAGTRVAPSDSQRAPNLYHQARSLAANRVKSARKSIRRARSSDG